MQTKYRTLLSLGLAALFSALSYAKAVPTSHARLKSPVVSQRFPTLTAPCAAPIFAQVLESALTPIKFTQSSCGNSISMGGVTNSCWASSHEMILFNGHQLVKFDTVTGEDVPIAGTEDAVSGKHWVTIISLSPDGHWLVWAGGVDGNSTWNAVSTDGAMHRQWPRAESIRTPTIAWMQDNEHWVELSVPETKINATAWQPYPDNMRARVFSLDSSKVLDFPLRLEVPDPAFYLQPNCGHYGDEFLFTADGHAWLEGGFSVSGSEALAISYTVYALLPSETVWKLHKVIVTPEADPEHWMYDAPTRSPDGNWVAWRNYSADPGCKMNGNARLMLSRTDGSEMQLIYQSDNGLSGDTEWSPDSRQIAFNTYGSKGICTVNLDQIIAGNCTKNSDYQRKAASIFGRGSFPISRLKPLNHPLVAARH